MTIGEFKQLARAMRLAQQNGLRQREELEAEFDRVLEECLQKDAPASVPAGKLPPVDLFGGAQTSAKPGHAQ